MAQLKTGSTVGGSNIYARNNILGTVSQSGGVPTGAIIQRGSNANGEFVRYADGTQICNFLQGAPVDRSIKALGSGTIDDPYRTEPFTWTYPAAFVGNDAFATINISVRTAVDSRRRIFATRRDSTATHMNEIQAFRLGTNSADTNVRFLLTAYGRWY